MVTGGFAVWDVGRIIWLVLKLAILDLDGTVRGAVGQRPPNTVEEIKILPGVADKLARLRRQNIKIVFASNQMGVGIRYAAETWLRGVDSSSALAGWCCSRLHYPTAEQVWRLAWATMERVGGADGGYLSFYYSPRPGQPCGPQPPDAGPEWLTGWRKPQPGMLLQACADFNVMPDEALMVGDMRTDRLAAEAIDVRFVFAVEFFAWVE